VERDANTAVRIFLAKGLAACAGRVVLDAVDVNVGKRGRRDLAYHLEDPACVVRRRESREVEVGIGRR